MNKIRIGAIVDEIKTDNHIREGLNEELCKLLGISSLEDRGNFIDEKTGDIVRVIRLNGVIDDEIIADTIKIENNKLEIIDT